ARKRAAANTLGGNIINCWAKATGKPVKRTRGDTVEEISHIQFPSPPPPPRVSCRYCLNTFESAQGRGVHEAAIHKVQRGVDGDCLWRQTRRREDLLRPWDGVGRGRCW
ncbi:unnamed protein product, partial [Ascophyllum nodosum]